MQVPFLDLKAQHASLRGEIIASIEEVIDSSAFAGGPFVDKFERDFAAFCDCQSGVGVGNGTDALWFALLALGVGRGDEVITVPSTFIATAEAISFCGATPVFVDVDERTYTLNPELLEKALTPRTKAIIPVHLFGQMADMDPIMEFARKKGLFVIEDACQAHGAEYKGRKAGSIGDAGCFSFYPGKNLGALGEAGAVVTNNPDLDQKIRILRDHGQIRKYHHVAVGWNGRMDGIQGAVLRIKLRHLAAANESRRAHATHYNESLQGLEGITLPHAEAFNRHVYHLYAIRLRQRDALMRFLSERSIGSGIHYPVPLHLQKAYQFLGLGPGLFPVAERCADEFLSLPMFPELSPAQVQFAVEAVKAFLLSLG